MVLKRFALILAALLAVQAAVFGYWYRDLLALRRPVAELVDDPQAFQTAAAEALGRATLTRRHLDTIVDGARRLKDGPTELRALERLVKANPDDLPLALRFAEALRLEGRLEEAATVYASVLTRASSLETAR